LSETEKVDERFFTKVLQPKLNRYRFVQSGTDSFSPLGLVEYACGKSRMDAEIVHCD
jgi:hypothetical protein